MNYVPLTDEDAARWHSSAGLTLGPVGARRVIDRLLAERERLLNTLQEREATIARLYRVREEMAAAALQRSVQLAREAPSAHADAPKGG